jgi:hypothetical protein
MGGKVKFVRSLIRAPLRLCATRLLPGYQGHIWKRMNQISLKGATQLQVSTDRSLIQSSPSTASVTRLPIQQRLILLFRDVRKTGSGELRSDQQ